MRICLSAVELFLDDMSGNRGAEEVLQHPAYQAINAHTRLIQGREHTEQDIALALQGTRAMPSMLHLRCAKRIIGQMMKAAR